MRISSTCELNVNPSGMLLAVFLVLFGVSCASGEISEGGGEEQEESSDAGGLEEGEDDVEGDLDSDGGSEELDADPGDPDSGPGDLCGSVSCPGVCDPETGDCVECLADGDCGDLVCDDVTNTCLGCQENSDCAGEEKCHDENSVCVAECCDFVMEDIFSDVSYSHDRFDIAVSGAGAPMVVFADTVSGAAANKIYLAQRLSGQWLQQEFAEFTGSTMNVRLEIDGEGDPHVVARRHNEWRYFHRDASGWEEEDVWSEQLGSGQTDVQIAEDGVVHIIGQDGEQLRYVRRDLDGTWQRESYAIAEENISWVSLGLKSDGSPVVSAILVPSAEIHIAERSGGGWSSEKVVDNATYEHHMAVGPTDEVMVVHRPTVSPHDGLLITRNGSGSWVEEVAAAVDTAASPHMAIDDRGDPHLIYSIILTNTTGEFGYTRWDGDSWEAHEILAPLVERAFRHRIAVDENYVAHIVVYDSSRDTISYLTVEP